MAAATSHHFPQTMYAGFPGSPFLPRPAPPAPTAGYSYSSMHAPMGSYSPLQAPLPPHVANSYIAPLTSVGGRTQGLNINSPNQPTSSPPSQTHHPSPQVTPPPPSDGPSLSSPTDNTSPIPASSPNLPPPIRSLNSLPDTQKSLYGMTNCLNGYAQHTNSISSGYSASSFTSSFSPAMLNGSTLFNNSYSTHSPLSYPVAAATAAEYSNQPVASSSLPLPLWNPCSPLPHKLSYDTPRFKLTPERATLLIKWFEEHKEHPYPSRHEKILLCQQTQLTFTQVSTWFANARRRMKKASQEEEEKTSGSEDATPNEASGNSDPEDDRQ